MTKHTPLTVLLMISYTIFTVGCSDEKASDKPTSSGAEQPPQTAGTKYSAANPMVTVGANSKRKLCHSWNKGERVQFRLSAAKKLHVGVSHGQDLGIDNLVPVHATRSEVRAFVIKNDGEHCFHFDNRDNQNIDVTFTYNTL